MAVVAEFGNLAAQALAAMSTRMQAIWQLLVAAVILAILGVVLADVCLRSMLGDPSEAETQRIVATLQRVADADTLLAEATTLVTRYAGPTTHELRASEQPDHIKKVMEALGLGVATVCDDGFGHRYISLEAPGGFRSYGIKVFPSSPSIGSATNTSGASVGHMTGLRWKDGIYVFSSH